MSSSLTFVPRQLPKPSKQPCQKPASRTTSSTAPNIVQPAVLYDRAHNTNTSRANKFSFQDYASLVYMAFSEYSLWSDPDLRQMVEPNDASTSDGFIPLNYLLTRSNVTALLNSQSQMTIVKALRENASDVFEVRLLVSDPSTSAWPHTVSEDTGAYEIRRKHRKDVLMSHSKADWNRKTVYVENIPVHHRDVFSVIRYILGLLSESPATPQHTFRIQGITFPPYHAAKSGELPKCKGFALVILTLDDDVEYLLRRWVWDRQVPKSESKVEQPNTPEAVKEATKFGFRALSRAQWEQLREEYLAYRQVLVDQINSFENEEAEAESAPEPVTRETKKPPRTLQEAEHVLPTSVQPSSPYPPDCLVFVRNIHVETNKTTLRKLFSAAFGSECQSNRLDYVDFNKGMDACYLRLATSEDARTLVGYFSHTPRKQLEGLDEVGMPVDSQAGSIAMELVVGKREELYWQKVPENVRKQAVKRALDRAQQTAKIVNINDYSVESKDSEPRKRRKH